MDKKKIERFIKDHKKALSRALVISVIIVALLFFYFNGEKDKKYINAEKSITTSQKVEKDDKDGKETSKGNMVVDISGQVVNPGVYELSSGSRLNDVINMAGGLKEDADIDSIKRAEPVEDGQKVFVPKIASEDEAEGTGQSGEREGRQVEKVNINKADMTQLQSIPGVGPATAEKIIQYRQTNGKFKAAEDLKNVSGIGDKTFEKMADMITVQ